MRDWTPDSKALGKGAPFTGTAIYLRPTEAWHEGAWPLWTHIVRHVDGCLGCSGGQILDPVDLLEEPALVGEDKVEGAKRTDGKWEGFLVYVGWESVVGFGNITCTKSVRLTLATRRNMRHTTTRSTLLSIASFCGAETLGTQSMAIVFSRAAGRSQ